MYPGCAASTEIRASGDAGGVLAQLCYVFAGVAVFDAAHRGNDCIAWLLLQKGIPVMLIHS
jgi:hypothetical protein